MINRISGTIIDKDPSCVVVNTGPMAFDVSISFSTFNQIPKVGEEVTLFTYLRYSSDDIGLFGFGTQEEKDVFLILLGLPKVGCTTALSILSSIGIPELVAAVQSQDKVRLSKIPGIGIKTAERLIFELKEKIKSFPASTLSPSSSATSAPGKGGFGNAGGDSVISASLLEQACSALVAWGCSQNQAEKAVGYVLNQAKPPENLAVIIKQAFKHRLSD